MQKNTFIERLNLPSDIEKAIPEYHMKEASIPVDLDKNDRTYVRGLLDTYSKLRLLARTPYFSSTPNLTSVDVSSFITSNVWDMSAMFASTRMKEINLDNFNTEKVRDFSYFAYNSAAETIHFRKLDFSSVTTLYTMFWRAGKLKNIYVEKIPTIPFGTITTGMWSNASTNHFTFKEY